MGLNSKEPMTIKDTLQSLSTYPIPVNFIDKTITDNGLGGADDYTFEISQSRAFKKASAEIYLFMYGAPSLTEQDISLSVVERSNYWRLAQLILGEIDDPRFDGITYGFMGDEF